MKQIESRANQVFKRAQKVISGNSNEKLIVVEGHKLLDEAIKSGATPEIIFVEAPQALCGKEELNRCSFQICRSLFRELSTVQTPGEIIAFLAPPPLPDIDFVLQKSSMILVFDRLQDPGNIGTIFRTAEAMGADLVVMLKGCCSPFNPKVIRAAMGSTFRLPFAAEIKQTALLALLKKHGITAICADMSGENLPEFKFPSRTALFFGQEGQGLNEEILQECNSRLAIPMQGQVESLNVATSAAICLYEWARNRRGH
ncbi:MAG: RNA methyltransferase [Candidatus Riflebacteria bacterium]|nr:RNA methyltransferase [Candidatus Riflebacteria bacterium]